MKVVEKMLDWENAGKMNLLSVGYSLRAPELLFRKIEDAEVEEQIQKLKVKSEALKQPEVAKETEKKESSQNPSSGGGEAKAEIQFDDFAKIDLKVGTIVSAKVGTIVSAEKVEKADKLLKLQVDLGFETRTIVGL